jgi:hypothetical protein
MIVQCQPFRQLTMVSILSSHSLSCRTLNSNALFFDNPTMATRLLDEALSLLLPLRIALQRAKANKHAKCCPSNSHPLLEMLPYYPLKLRR